MAAYQRLPGICSFEQDLINNSATNQHYIIRNKEKGEYLWLYCEEELDDIPKDWRKVLKLAHPIGDWASSEIYNVEISDESLIIQGTFKGPKLLQEFHLKCTQGKGDTIYTGTFSLGDSVTSVQILRKDCSKTVLFESFPYRDSGIEKGFPILYKGEIYYFVSWNGPAAVKLERQTANGKVTVQPSVSSCKKVKRPQSRKHYSGVSEISKNLDSSLASSSSSASSTQARDRAEQLAHMRAQLVAQIQQIDTELASLTIANN